MLRKLPAAALCLAVLAAACDGPAPLRLPAQPSQPVATAPAPPRVPFADISTLIMVGEVVTREYTMNDPECPELPGWQCQFFRLEAPRDGTLDVGMKQRPGHSGQGLDLSIGVSGSYNWWAVHFGTEAELKVPAKAGTTYEITVWYTTPGVTFELRTSLE